uniref:Uncharacterized protein n=1 Tax=viral metagenome TaxID=1070528 RepID=A0A6C0JY55_9ZZZZ
MMDIDSQKYKDLENELDHIQLEQLRILNERALKIKQQLLDQNSIANFEKNSYIAKTLLNE